MISRNVFFGRDSLNFTFVFPIYITRLTKSISRFETLAAHLGLSRSTPIGKLLLSPRVLYFLSW